MAQLVGKKPAFDSETACLGSLEDVCSDWPLYESNGLTAPAPVPDKELVGKNCFAHTLAKFNSKNLFYTNYKRDLSRGIISRQKLGRVEIEIGMAIPTF